MHAAQLPKLAIVAVLVIGLLSAAPLAGAHAYLDESTPNNGEQLETVPDEISLSYTGDGIQVADVSVTGPNDGDIAGEAEIDPETRQSVTVPIEEAGDGMYLVEWEVLADDGHTTTGTFLFTVGDEDVDRDAVIASYEDGGGADISWIEAGTRGLLLASLAGLVGVAVTAVVALRPVVRHRAKRIDSATTQPDESQGITSGTDRRLLGLLSCLAGVLFISTVVFGIENIRDLGGITVDTAAEFLGTSVGRVWIWQLIWSLAAVGIVAGGWYGFLSQRGVLSGSIAAGVTTIAGLAYTSHSATSVDIVVGGVIGGAHLLAASLWAGGLFLVAVFLPRFEQLDGPNRSTLTAAFIRRYSVLALAGAAVTVGAGLVLGSWHAVGDAGLTSTTYGAVLAVKLPLVGVALLFGGYHRFVALPRLTGSSSSQRWGISQIRTDGGDNNTQPQSNLISRLHKTVRIELVVLVFVLLLSGVLTSAAPAVVAPTGDDFERATMETELDNDLVVSMTARSETAEAQQGELILGENEVVVFDVAFEQDGERVTAGESVELLATTADRETTFELELESDDGELYSAVTTMPRVENWRFRVTGEPGGAFESAWFESFVVPGFSEELAQSDPYEATSLTGPLPVAGVMIVLAGLLGAAYDAWLIRRRAGS